MWWRVVAVVVVIAAVVVALVALEPELDFLLPQGLITQLRSEQVVRVRLAAHIPLAVGRGRRAAILYLVPLLPTAVVLVRRMRL